MLFKLASFANCINPNIKPQILVSHGIHYSNRQFVCDKCNVVIHNQPNITTDFILQQHMYCVYSNAPPQLGINVPPQLGINAPPQLGINAPPQLGINAPPQLGINAPQAEYTLDMLMCCPNYNNDVFSNTRSLMHERLLYNTYNGWPGVSPLKCVKAGFKFCNNLLICIHCNFSTLDFTTEPIILHFTGNPNCEFLRNARYRKKNVVLFEVDFKNQINNNMLANLSLDLLTVVQQKTIMEKCIIALHKVHTDSWTHNLRYEINRLNTFTNWNLQNCVELASSGLYFESGKVQCWFCSFVGTGIHKCTNFYNNISIKDDNENYVKEQLVNVIIVFFNRLFALKNNNNEPQMALGLPKVEAGKPQMALGLPKVEAGNYNDELQMALKLFKVEAGNYYDELQMALKLSKIEAGKPQMALELSKVEAGNYDDELQMALELSKVEFGSLREVTTQFSKLEISQEYTVIKVSGNKKLYTDITEYNMAKQEKINMMLLSEQVQPSVFEIITEVYCYIANNPLSKELYNTVTSQLLSSEISCTNLWLCNFIELLNGKNNNLCKILQKYLMQKPIIVETFDTCLCCKTLQKLYTTLPCYHSVACINCLNKRTTCYCCRFQVFSVMD